MELRQAEFSMSSEYFPEALKAIKDLAGQETINDGSGKHFSWVVTERFLSATTLPEAMKEWRWKVAIDDTKGNVIGIDFMGEKLGDDEALFNAIAPYVTAGSFIEMQGEDASIWRWVFDDGTCVEKSPSIYWE